MLLDRKTYSSYASSFEITRYPVRDAQNDELEADPYDEKMFDRYPSWINFDYLNLAASLRRTIAKPLPDVVANRVFHIRARGKKTWVELKWAPIKGSQYNPDNDTSPISGKTGEGDGTIPWWSARLVQVPDSQVFDLAMAKEHDDLLEHPETLKVIERLIEQDRMPWAVTVSDKSLGRPKASQQRVKQFIEDVSMGKINRQDSSATDEKIWRRIIREANLC
jgi:hypothetical protein